MAAAPATCGEAMDVPLLNLLAVVVVWLADMTLTPGAKTSTHPPKLLNVARRSAPSVAPTVMAPAEPAGE